MDFNDFLGLVFSLYCLSFCINMICIDKAHLFDLRVSIVFTITYLILSPLTVFYSVGRAMETWYQITANKKAIIDTLRAEIADTKYNTLSDKDLYSITGVLAENLEYAEFEDFESIFAALEKDGYIVSDNGVKYYFKEQTGQIE